MLYYRHFGKALKQDIFGSLVKDLMKDAFTKGGTQVEFYDYYKYRISYISEKEQELMFLFVTGLTDIFDNIKKELIKCKKEFLNLFEDILQHKYDSKTFEVFDPTIDAIHRNLRPKISLVGFSGVGKTTITRLIKAEEIPMQHIPTITGDIATIKIGKLHFHLWDFAGQEQFSYLWNNFIKGSDAVLLITDSTLENVEKSKFFLELIKEQAPYAHSSVIANKQDLKDVLSPNQIEKIVGLKAYSMIAKDENNRDKMITIIADILEMSAEVSPLLKPLLERDNLIEMATNALQSAEFQKAANYFEKISDLCIELGDDSLGKEFYEKSKKIREMLTKASNLPVEKVVQPETATSKKVVVKEKIEQKMEEKPVIDTPRPPPQPIHPLKLEKAPPPFKPLPQKQETKEAVPVTPLEVKEQKLAQTDTTTLKKIVPTQPEISHIENQKSEVKIPISGGLDLKPEDFMVTQRPKAVVSVPKDAKQKLKTSPFAQVTNPPEIKTSTSISPIKPKAEIPPIKRISEPLMPPQISPPHIKLPEIPREKVISPTPITPIEMIKSKPTTPSISSSIPAPTFSPPTEPAKPNEIKSEGIDSQQRENLEKSLTDLKIKKASISKMALDFDMKELTGEITGDELEQKKKKLSEIEQKINQQIKDIEKLLGR
ncbi:MAG: ADP-ribosylation factor-like protein [Candidatus Thorarchaeota archaeon]